MVSVSYGFIIAFDVAVILIIVLISIFFVIWYNSRRFKTMMVAEIWQTNGIRKRHLVKPEDDGTTVRVKGCTYVLSQEKEEEGGNPVAPDKPFRIRPAKQFISWPCFALLGIRFFDVMIRVEAWEENNPEPIRPFYGKFLDKEGKPCDPEAEGAIFHGSQLMITASQLTAQKNVIQAVAIAQKVQETEARWKTFERALANIPNKMIMYLMLFVAAAAAVINVFLLMRIMAAVGGY